MTETTVGQMTDEDFETLARRTLDADGDPVAKLVEVLKRAHRIGADEERESLRMYLRARTIAFGDAARRRGEL